MTDDVNISLPTGPAPNGKLSAVNDSLLNTAVHLKPNISPSGAAGKQKQSWAGKTTQLQFRTNARAIVWKGKCCRKFCNSKKTQKLEEEKGGEGCNQWQTCWWGTAEGHWFDNDRTKGGSLVAVKVTEEDNVICVPPNIPLLLYLKLCSLTLALGLKVLFTTNVLADNEYLNVSQVISFSPLGHI